MQIQQRYQSTVDFEEKKNIKNVIRMKSIEIQMYICRQIEMATVKMQGRLKNYAYEYCTMEAFDN